MTHFMPTARRASAAVVASTVLAVLFTAGPAYAADVAERAITIPPLWLPVIAGLVVNLATAITTRIDARSWVKAVVALFFTAVAALIQNVMAAGGVLNETMFNTFVVTFVFTVAEYFGIVRPTRVPEVMAPAVGVV